MTAQVQWLFRSMQSAEDGLPLLDASSRTLGARPQVDIPIDDSGMVQPGTGGMSVSPDDPRNLPPHRRPPGFGGTGLDQVFTIREADLGSDLVYRADPANPSRHGFIEPMRPMTFQRYQVAIWATRTAWSTVRQP